jgi:GNAT superfamily N-acetyltransferase
MDRAAFSCGDESIPACKDLSAYFRDHAADHHGKGWVRVYVAVHNGKIVGYYWLSTQGANPNKLSPETRENMGRIEFASCVYLGMLATQVEYHGSGIGPTMMVDAFRQALKVAEYVGVYDVTLQAVDKRTADKYREDFDFQYFDDGTKVSDDSKDIWMFLPVPTIRGALAKAT